MAMRRRTFIAGLGSAAAWPAVAGAQLDRIRHIGVLMSASSDDPEYQTRIKAFEQGLAGLGWNEGGNARIDTRWATTNADDIRRHAAELVARAPDVVVA